MQLRATKSGGIQIDRVFNWIFVYLLIVESILESVKVASTTVLSSAWLVETRIYMAWQNKILVFRERDGFCV